MAMRVRPSDSRKVIWAEARRVGGGGVVGGKVRKTKVEGWRVGLREARRNLRDVEPGAGVGDVILGVVDGRVWRMDGKGRRFVGHVFAIYANGQRMVECADNY